MKKLILLLPILMSSVSWARQAQTQAMLNIRTTDGVVNNYPYQLKVSSNSLTDNADGTMTLSVVPRGASLIPGTTIYISSGTIVSFNSSTATITNLVGTTTNDNAAVGNYGEYISSKCLAAGSSASTAWGDPVAITLGAGDWDVSFVLFGNPGSTWTDFEIGISTVSGNNSATLVNGDNKMISPGTTVGSVALPNVRMSLSTSTIVYGKHVSVFGTTLVLSGRISARRVR